MSEKSVTDIKEQKTMIIVGIVTGILIIYSAFFAHQLPYSFTQYMGYSFMKLILFAIVVMLTYVNPAIGVAALIALLSTFQYFYMQKAFRRNMTGRIIKNDIKKVERKIKKGVEEIVANDDEDKKEAELKAEVAEAMCSMGSNTGATYMRDNSYFMTENNYPEFRMQDNRSFASQPAQTQLQSQMRVARLPNANTFTNPSAGNFAYPQGLPKAQGPDCFPGDNAGNTFYPSFVNENNAAYDSQFQPASAGIDEYNFMQQYDRRNRA